MLVGLGGAIGSVLRYLTSVLAAHWLGDQFPYGTLIVNLVGSFAIGLVHQVGSDTLLIPDNLRIFLTTGVMGGLTTYSTFSYETVRLMETGAWTQAWLNIAVTTTVAIGLCFLGMAAGPPPDRPAGVSMRKIEGEQILMRIFIGESDRWERRPLYAALVELFRAKGLAGATVLRGVAGFGPNSILHTAGILKLSADLPMVIEVVDSQEHLDAVLPEVDRMMGGGLITMEKVRVLRYAP